MSEQNSIEGPFRWIELELQPIPSAILEKHEGFTVWWNPEERSIVGEGAERVMEMIKHAMEKGCCDHLLEEKLKDPLCNARELAAVLAQSFWVLPKPVHEPQFAVA